MPGPVRPLRLVAKAALLFGACEALLASIPLPFAAASTYAMLGLRRERLPSSTLPAVDAALDVGNLDAMLASHVVSQQKAPNEFRVMVLGDSAVWGPQLAESQTLPSQLNSMHLTCGEENPRFYNLSYPRSSATKDLMILDKAMAFKPDLVMWLITWYTLMPKTRIDHWLITQNPGEFARLGRRFDFLPKDYHPPNLLDDIVQRNGSLFRVARYELYPLVQSVTARDQILGPPEQLPGQLGPDTTFEGLKPPTLQRSQVSLDQVQDFYTLAGGVPVLLINEPMRVVEDDPNSDVRYNAYYPRWVYDQYRRYVQELANRQQWDYLDLWSDIPPTYFADTPLHLTPDGQRLLAQMLAPHIQALCP